MNVNHVYLQFNGDLKDFLTSNNEIISVDFKGRQSVKHIIESLGVPHPEVHKIFVNKQLTSFSYILEDNDFVEVFPWQPGDVFPLNYPIEIRFILDCHLGKLATYMRMLGIDTLYQNDYQDDEIVRSINNGQRILLTKDRRLLMRREIHWGYCVRQDNPLQQLNEVIGRFNLRDETKPFNRCLRCNHEINPIDKLAIIHRLEPLTKLYYEEFYYCPRCDQIYWKGSHYEHMLSFIRQFGQHNK